MVAGARVVWRRIDKGRVWYRICIALERFMGKIRLALGYGVCFLERSWGWHIEDTLGSMVHLEGRLKR